jgi:hypothetical protein
VPRGLRRVLHRAVDFVADSGDCRCAIFGRPERPAVCVSLRPSESMCGVSRDEAMRTLAAMEAATAPRG